MQYLYQPKYPSRNKMNRSHWESENVSSARYDRYFQPKSNQMKSNLYSHCFDNRDIKNTKTENTRKQM